MRAQLVARLRLDRNFALRTELRSEPREEQANEMINLRDGRHRALAAAACRALLDAHRGRNAGDEIDIGPRHLLHELARVSVHGIQKAPLAFREDEVKSERALARSADAGDDDKFPPRNLQRDV